MFNNVATLDNGILTIKEDIEELKIIEIQEFAKDAKIVVFPKNLKRIYTRLDRDPNCDFFQDYLGDMRDFKQLEVLDFSKCVSLRCIPAFLFQNCMALRGVRLSPSVIKIETSAFSGCENLTTVAGLENVKILERDAFRDTNITDVVLNRVETLEDECFSFKTLRSLTIPDSGKLLSVRFNDFVEYKNLEYFSIISSNPKTEYEIGASISPVEPNTSLKSITVDFKNSEGWVSIYHCEALREVHLLCPNTELEWDFLFNCPKVELLELSDNVLVRCVEQIEFRIPTMQIKFLNKMWTVDEFSNLLKLAKECPFEYEAKLKDVVLKYVPEELVTDQEFTNVFGVDDKLL